MSLTIIEKIISAHCGQEVKPGEIVWMNLDLVSARDFGGPNVVKHYQREYGDSPVFDSSRIAFTFDLCVPACTLKYADNQQVCRKFARQHGLRVFDVDQGIGSHVMMDKGLAGPGKTVGGTDSHLNILGAVCCFGQGMGDVDITFSFKTGKTWFEVPPTVKVEVKGKPSSFATPKDLTLFLCKTLGTKKVALKAVEFYGEAVRNLSLDGRITLCSMVTEMAGIIGFVPELNNSTMEEMITLPGFNLEDWVTPEQGAEYEESIEVDVSGLGPQVAVPYLPHKVREVDEIKGTKIDTGFIGSCTNGRVEDFRLAAKILKGRKIKEGITLKCVPATRQVYQQLLEEGILETLIESGAIVSNPGCGGCADGHIGLTGEGEVQISTGNRNFYGKQGKGKTYLASPAVVAASCLAGEIISPEEI